MDPGQVTLLLDSNILIDYLKGVEAARDLINSEQEKAISLITWMEVLVGTRTDEEFQIVEAWMGRFQIAEIDSKVARRAVYLRREYSLRLPDAIIWASAQMRHSILVTRNTRDFPPDAPGIHIPYQL